MSWLSAATEIPTVAALHLHVLLQALVPLNGKVDWLRHGGRLALPLTAVTVPPKDAAHADTLALTAPTAEGRASGSLELDVIIAPRKPALTISGWLEKKQSNLVRVGWGRRMVALTSSHLMYFPENGGWAVPRDSLPISHIGAILVRQQDVSTTRVCNRSALHAMLFI